MRERAFLIGCLAALTLVGVGCGSGSGDSTAAVADSPAGATIEAETDSEHEEAIEVQEYFGRNCAPPGAIDEVPEKEREIPAYANALRGMEAMCGKIISIKVEGERVIVRSDIDPRQGELAGPIFCELIQGSDVADFTPGHELQASDGSTIKVCPARTD
jgi:hypothetical protein